MTGHMKGYFKLKSLVHFVSKCILLYIDFFCHKHRESVLDVLSSVINYVDDDRSFFDRG